MVKYFPENIYCNTGASKQNLSVSILKIFTVQGLGERLNGKALVLLKHYTF